jgi:ABC-type uncharacterized transport system substrate-binding protein
MTLKALANLLGVVNKFFFFFLILAYQKINLKQKNNQILMKNMINFNSKQEITKTKGYFKVFSHVYYIIFNYNVGTDNNVQARF